MDSGSTERAPDRSGELAPFVSELARAWQRDAPELTEREIVGTLVFADISGFTRLTERLAAKGRIGAEEMSDHLDGVLSELLTAAYDHGGWLVKWGGDALLLMFDGPDHLHLACAASAAMQARMRRAGMLNTSVGRVRLRMSIGVHSGTFEFHFLGPLHRELLITGDAATVTARLEAAAEAGEILLSPQAAGGLPAECLGAPKAGGILMARAPAGVLMQPQHGSPVGDVSGLVPELVAEHLERGGGVGEHRHVTVAFLEFSGMAGLRKDGGPVAVSEGLSHLVDVTQRACHRNVVSFHETDISSDGGKIMLVAGAPRGLEDSAEAMLSTLRQVFDDPGTLTIRAGVTSGRVFAGAVGPARRRSYSVKGDVVNVAARIMGKTAPGRIWALPTVTEASRTRFDLGDVPRFLVKGKTAPIQVRSVGRALARVDFSPDLPLIGRVDEMAILETALDQARSGDGRHVDLVGAPGIGKSRLLAELRRLADEMTVLTAAADIYRAASPYSLFRPLLLDALGLGDVDGAALPSELDAWCGEHVGGLRPWLPLLAPVLGVTIAETPETLQLAPEFHAERTHALVLELLRAALPGPLLLVVDDLQFADEASEAVLRHVALNVAGQPWLIVLTDRGDDGAAQPQAPTSQTLWVGPLSVEESLILAYADTDNAPLPPHVTDAVVERAGGNPLFLRNLAAAAHTLDQTAELPDSIETVVAARIDRLRPAARDVLRAAAVVGISVDRRVLVELLANDPTRPAGVLDELDEYLAATPSGLRFRQVVIRDTAYAGLPFRRRTMLHGRLADLLAARPPEDGQDHAAVLSLHYFRAGNYERALPTARAAADRAAEAHVNVEAALLYQRALAAAGRLHGVDRHVRAELFERLGDSQRRLGEYELSDRTYSAACRLRGDEPLRVAWIGLKRARAAELRGAYDVVLRRLRGISALVRDLPGQDAADVRIAVTLRAGFTQFGQGRLAAARRSYSAVIDRGDERRNPEQVADALAMLDVVESRLGVAVDGHRARRALLLQERGADLAGQARVHGQIGYHSYFDGRWDDAVAAYQRAGELYRRVGDLPSAAVNDANVAEILLDQGRLVEAEEALRSALRIWRASGSENEVAFGRALLGRVLARLGEYDEAEELLEKARERFVAQGAKTEVVDADAYRAELLMLRGSVEEALSVAEGTLAAASRLSKLPAQGPLLHRLMAVCQDRLGRPDEADRSFGLALDLARRRGADHELVFTVAAMMARDHNGGHSVDPALLEEVEPLQRRLRVVLDPAAEAARAGERSG